MLEGLIQMSDTIEQLHLERTTTCIFNFMKAGYNIIKNITYFCNSIVVLICDD